MTMRDTKLIPSFQRPPSTVVIRRVADYDQDLSAVIEESLSAFRLPIQGKTVLLKPNLVGLDPLGFVNTHPAVIAATRECFLRLGAAQVFIVTDPPWIAIPRRSLSRFVCVTTLVLWRGPSST